ncbi:MAG: hypothetical protein P9L92_15215 [Candidatus Electryonea clarkiae]|nr:hypothetical protein [Candidatus Electryonea clarkiae]MDP8287530.1 hypothetical protein [Candidatus Electryonea clarkiae]
MRRKHLYANLIIIFLLVCITAHASFWKPSKAWDFRNYGHKNPHLFNYGSSLPVIVNDYVTRFGGYPRYFLWENDTTEIDLDWGITYRSMQTPGQNYTWGQLRQYFFWSIKDAEGDTSFYAPCTLGVDTTHVGGQPGFGMGYRLRINAWDLPLPKDSTVFGVKLLIFDTTATTGTIQAEVASFTILKIPIETAMDSLLWIMGNGHKTVENMEYVTERFPRSYLTQIWGKIVFWEEEEWVKARRCVLRMISILEKNNDSTPYGPKTIEARKKYKSMANVVVHPDYFGLKKPENKMERLRNDLIVLDRKIAEQ